jgi:hypothetical protein
MIHIIQWQYLPCALRRRLRGNKVEEIIINGETYIKKQGNNDLHYVIVRTYSAGVFAGFLESRIGQEVIIRDARRLWYWDGASSLSQLATEGTKKPENCRFPCAVDRVELLQVIEILYVTDCAKKSIERVAIWSQ